MAVSESIREGIDALQAALYEAQSFVETCDQLAGTDVRTRPPWVDCVTKHVERLSAASEALEVLLFREVIRPMEASRAKP